MSPTDDPAAQMRWREAANEMHQNSRALLEPMREHLEALGYDFESEVAGVTVAAFVEWAHTYPDDAAWWCEQLVEQGRQVAVRAYGVGDLEFDSGRTSGMRKMQRLLRIDDAWRGTP